MAIYTRFGSVVTLVRPVTTLQEVENLENRKADDHDKQRLHYGMYVLGHCDELPDNRLMDLTMLRADDGIREIHTAARAIGCDPR